MSDYTTITALADQLNATEAARITAENQHRAMGETTRRLLPVYAKLGEYVALMKQCEKVDVKALQEATEAHPLWSTFFAGIYGCGAKGAGRLLGVIGDPTCYVNQDGETVQRMVSSLWHYCGYAPGFDKHKRGEQGSYNPTARKVLHNIAAPIIKLRGQPYRDIYDARKAATEGRVHAEPCKNSVKPIAGKPAGSNGCGTQEHPEWGAIGSPWRPEHKNKDAMRVMMKMFLRDLWLAAHELPLDHNAPGNQASYVEGLAVAA